MDTSVFCYPKRDQCFAHRFVRLLHKSCAIQEIGLDGFALLVIVAHTEDAIRYKGPVGFWNQTLLEILGMAKWDQLSKARQKCIDGGWLKYHGDGKRTPGQYFVTIPENYLQLDDGPIDHQYTLVNPETRYKQGYDDGYKAGYDHGYKAGDVHRDVQGEPFCPIPYVPDPFKTQENLIGECHVPESLSETDVEELKRFMQVANEHHFNPFPPNSPQVQSVLRLAAKKKKEGYDIPEVCDTLVSANAKTFQVYKNVTRQRDKPADQHETFLAMQRVAREHGGDSDSDREWRRNPKNVPREWVMAMKETGLNWQKILNDNSFERKRNAEILLEAIGAAKAKLILEGA